MQDVWYVLHVRLWGCLFANDGTSQLAIPSIAQSWSTMCDILLDADMALSLMRAILLWSGDSGDCGYKSVTCVTVSACARHRYVAGQVTLDKGLSHPLSY